MIVTVLKGGFVKRDPKLINYRDYRNFRSDNFRNGVPGVPKKHFPYLSCYFSKSVFYFIKILKGICYTMLHLDLSICFISVSTRIDFL